MSNTTTTTVTTSLSVANNKVDPRVLTAFLATLPKGAEVEFVITKGYDDRTNYAPDRVTAVKATWKQEFEA